VPLDAAPGSVVDLAAPLAGSHVVTGYDRGDFNPFYAGPKTLRRLAPAGDVDGDGHGDLLVGMAETDVEGVEPDESPYQSTGFLVLGGGPAALPRIGARGLRIDGIGGESFPPLVSVGDVVGDDRPDVLAGSTQLLRSLRLEGEGRRTFREYGGGPATVVSGARRGRVDLVQRGRGVVRLRGRAATVAAGPGDVDGDGRGDIVLATERGEGHRTDLVDVFSARQLRTRRRRAAPFARLRGPRRGATGRAVAGAGDFDGDRRADLLVSVGRGFAVVTARRLTSRP
jgi:hypothetical protein